MATVLWWPPEGGQAGPWFGKGVERLDHLFQAAKINLPSFYCSQCLLFLLRGLYPSFKPYGQ